MLSDELKRTRKLTEAEGYLELLSVFADRWEPRISVRDRLARKAIDVLNGLGGDAADLAHASYLTGQAYRTMGCHEEAIEALKRSAERKSANVSVLLALGWCYKRTGRLDLAISVLEDALKIQPKTGIIHYNLACYLSLAKRADDAIKHLWRSIKIDPSYRDSIASEPDFDGIRDDPRVIALASRDGTS